MVPVPVCAGAGDGRELERSRPSLPKSLANLQGSRSDKSRESPGALGEFPPEGEDQVGSSNDHGSPPGLVLPPDLQGYLPSDQWRRLTGAAPPRGVLLNALSRLRSLLYLLSTYLPSHLVQQKMRRPTPGLARGQLLQGSLLFADVSGFTALSEQLASLGQEGAERLTDMMNRYFEKMLTILAWSGGILLKFAGDALLVYFPEQDNGEQARWAIRAGQRAMSVIAGLGTIETLLGAVGLQIKIGVGTGSFLASSVGSAERMEYVILGPAVAQTMAAEGAAQVGQLMADAATAACLESACCVKQADGFYQVRWDAGQDLDDYEIRAERRRARGAIPWSASPRAIAIQMELALRQIQALTPYLATELVERLVARARRRGVESEFRPTTVLFLNFTGLETLLAAWGDAPGESGRTDGVREVTRLLDEYFRIVQRVVASHGGVVSRIDPYSQGSKMLVLFGAPVAHEDDPQRAIGVALALDNELASLNRRWLRRLAGRLPPSIEGSLIQQRIGITQGPTFAGQVGSPTRREYTVMGDDVNLAARLMAAAQPGQTLISQRVYDAVVNHFVAIPLPPIRVKGKSQPIPIYQPATPRDDPLARRSRNRGALVGRGAELDSGRQAISRALGGQGSMLTIQGPAGVGKSHLADTLAAYAQARGARILFSECRSYTSQAPYAPWTDLLHSLTGIVVSDSPGARRGKLLQALAGLELAASEYAAPLADLLGLGGIHSLDVSPQPAKIRKPEQPIKSKKAALFARLEQRVTPPRSAQKGKGLDLWQLVRERPSSHAQGRQGAESNHMWQNLQARVSAHQQERLFAAVRELLTRVSAQTPLLILFENSRWMDAASRGLLAHLGERLNQLPILLLVLVRSARGNAGTTDVGQGGTLTLAALGLEDTTTWAGHLLGQATVPPDLARAIHKRSGGNPLFVREIVRWMQRTGNETVADLKGDPSSTLLQELVLSHLDSLSHSQRDAIKAASVVGYEFSRSAIRALLPSTYQGAGLDSDLCDLERERLILLTEAGVDACYAFRDALVCDVVYNGQSFARRRELHASVAAYLEAGYSGGGPQDRVQQGAVQVGQVDFLPQQVDPLAQQAERLAYHYQLSEQFLPAARYLLISGHKARQRYAYSQASDYYGQALAALDRVSPQVASVESVPLRIEAHEGQGDLFLLTGDFSAAAIAYEAAHSHLVDPVPAGLLLKLALVLPTQEQDAQAEAFVRRVWAADEEPTRLAAAATLAWLLWRAGRPEASDWIERGRALAAQGTDRWTAGVAALLADLAGDWPSALRAYLDLDRPAGAALAACRQGDRCLVQADPAKALNLYAQAAEIWVQENDACGLALARYREAEALWRKGDAADALAALREAQSLLEEAPSGHDPDRLAIQQAISAINAAKSGAWPAKRWQHYDDTFRISVLFRS